MSGGVEWSTLRSVCKFVVLMSSSPRKCVNKVVVVAAALSAATAAGVDAACESDMSPDGRQKLRQRLSETEG